MTNFFGYYYTKVRLNTYFLGHFCVGVTEDVYDYDKIISQIISYPSLINDFIITRVHCINNKFGPSRRIRK